jgi:hypothetical protein
LSTYGKVVVNHIVMEIDMDELRFLNEELEVVGENKEVSEKSESLEAYMRALNNNVVYNNLSIG